MEVTLNQKHFDFGALQYTFDGSSRTLTVEIQNTSDLNTYTVFLSIFTNFVNDFPVNIFVDKWLDENEQPIEVTEYYLLKPKSRLKSYLKLLISNETINVLNPRTSYFKVANRCSLQYLKVNQEDPTPSISTDTEKLKLEFSFSAMLCTSIMFIEKPEADFQECNIHDVMIQELMIWNRSESELQFRIHETNPDLSLSPSSSSDNDFITFYEVDNDEPIRDQIVSIPSFAPKIIQIHLNGQTLGSFQRIYTFQNENTQFNALEVIVKGRIVSPHSEITDVLTLSESIMTDHKFISMIDFGSCSLGVKKNKVFWIGNLTDKLIKVRLTLPEESELKISFQTNEKTTDEEKMIPYQRPKPDENYMSSIQAKYESNFSWVNKDDAPKKDSSVTLSSVCGMLFGSESLISETSGMRFYDEWKESDYEYLEPFNNRRMLLGDVISDDVITSSLKNQEKEEITKFEKIKDRELILLLKPQAKASFYLEVAPEVDHMTTVMKGQEKRLSKRRDRFLNISYDIMCEDIFYRLNEIDLNLLESDHFLEVKGDSKTVEVRYQISASVIDVKFSTLDLGICRVSDSYSYVIHVHNNSPVSTTILPDFATGANELEMHKFTLLPNEDKDIPFYFFPISENPEYKNTLTLKNLENENNCITIKLIGQIIDSKILQFHDNFYKLFHDTNNRIQGQLQLSKGIYNMPNIGLFKIRNVWNYDITLQFLLRKDSFIRLIDLYSGQNLSKYEQNYKKTDQSSVYAHEIEEMKWGDHKLKHSQSMRLSIGELSPRVGRDKLPLNHSKGVDALDLTSAKYNKTNKIMGDSRSVTKIPEFLNIPEIAIGNLASLDEKLNGTLSKASSNSDLGRLEDENSLLRIVKFINDTVIPWIFDDGGASEIKEGGVSFATDEKDPNISEKDKPKEKKPREAVAQTPQQLASKIKNVQEAYRMLSNIYEYEKNLVASNFPGDLNMIPARKVTVKKGSTLDVAILWQPKALSTALNGIGSATDLETGFRESMKDWFQIKIIDFIPPNLNLSVEDLFASHPDLSSEHVKSLLEPRMVFIREECVLSEMTVIQKTINYGRVVVGDSLSKIVTIVNKSSVGCLYSFSKSGSITSGFLTIAQGRKGFIEPFSTKTLEIIFKPTMPCAFEEILNIKNLLNPLDSQLITVKAKVLRSDSFNISLINETLSPECSLSKIFEPSLEDSLTEGYKKVLSYLSKDVTPPTSTQLPAPVVPVATNEAPPNLSVLKGFAIVGKNPCLTIKFKIRNTTGKKRQFIIDGTRDDSIELFTFNRIPQESDFYRNMKKDEYDNFNSLLSENGQLFASFQDVYKSILSARCQFYSEVVVRRQTALGANEEEETQLLLDQLEKFQQKLKINTRKKKQEKIAKYQKKINEIIAKLSGSGGSNDPSNSQNDKNSDPPLGESVKAEEISKEVEYSELVHHLTLNPDEERLITVKFSYLPSFYYHPWSRMLPFIGRIRIFELKNEDFVRSILFGVFLFSSERSFDSFLNPSLETVLSNVSPVVSPEKSANSSVVPSPERMVSKHPFIIVIQPWCTHPTKDVQPKYKKFPLNTLPVCIKLVKSTKDRILTARFSIDYSEIKDGAISVRLDETFAASVTSGDYKAFSSKKFGHLHLFVDDLSTSTNLSSVQDPLVDGNCYDLSTGSYEFSCPMPLRPRSGMSGFRKDLSLVWTPSSHVMSSPEEIRLFGLLNISYEHHSLTNGQSLLVPFICAFQHASTIKVDRYITFENVHVGSYSTYQMVVQNNSESQELHYMISFEHLHHIQDERELIGKLDIMQGKTGVINPGAEKRITLIFSGNSIGKFEQKLWVQNINDSFDQKRVVVQANVTLAQTKFIKLPDLEHSDHSMEKFTTIDFGKVQFKSDKMIKLPIAGTSFVTPDAYEANNPYRLRVRNVSNDCLSFTVQPNLKNQCYIFEDSECLEPQKTFILRKAETKEVFILLRPTDVEKSKATSSFPATVSSEVAAFSGVEIYDVRSIHEMRELLGGIRLIFSKVENEAEETNSVKSIAETDQAVPIVAVSGAINIQKLFEIALSFRANVGKSVLLVKNTTFESPSPSPASNVETNVILISRESLFSSPGASPWICSNFVGKLELFNLSKHFPLRYQIFDESNTTTFVDSKESMVSYIPLVDSEVHLVIVGTSTGSLPPNGHQKLEFSLLLKNMHVFGLFFKQLNFYNVDTNEVFQIDLLFHIESNKLTAHYIQSDSPTIRSANPFADLQSSTNATSIPIFPLCEKIWIKTISRHTDQNVHQFMNTEDIGALEKAYIEKAIRFDVSTSTDALLGTIVLNNPSNRSISLIPMSELPIYTLMETSITAAVEEGRPPLTSQLSKRKDLFDAAFSNEGEPSSQIAKEENAFQFGFKQRKLRKCGNTFTIKANSEVRLFIKISVKEIERPLFTDSQLRLLLQGRTINIQGLLCFVESVSKLQTMFLPPPSPGPSSQPPATPLSDAPFGKEIMEVVSLPSLASLVTSNLCCQIIYPRILVDQLKFDLGTIRWNMKQSFVSRLKNLSSIEVLCSLEPIPEWLNVEIKKLKEGEEGSVITPYESIMPNYEYHEHNAERFLFFSVDPRSTYLFSFQVNLAGRIPENIASSVKQSLLLKFFSTNADHPNHKEANFTMTSLSYAAFTQYNLEISFILDSRSMLEVAVMAPTSLTTVSRNTIADQTTDTSSPISALHKLECIFNEYFVVPPPTRLDPNTMNSLLQRIIGDANIGGKNYSIPTDLHRKFSFLSQTYTFWLKNNSKESIEVEVEFVSDPLLSKELQITYKIEDSAFPADSTNANNYPSTAGSGKRRLKLNVGESISLSMKIAAKVPTRWNEEKLEVIRQFYSISQELINLSTVSALASAVSNLTLSPTQENSKTSNRLQLIIQRLRRFRIGPCLFGCLKLAAAPINSINDAIDKELGISTETKETARREQIEASEYTEIDLKGSLALGSTLYLLPATPFPFIHQMQRSGSEQGEFSLRKDDVIMYQDKKGYWYFSFPTTKISNDSVSLSPPSFRKSCLQLSAQEHSFYLVNMTDEPFQYCSTSVSCRYPGLHLLMKESLQEKEEKDISYYCDTISVCVEPSEGEIPPNSMQLVTIRLQSSCPSDSTLYDSSQLTYRYFREEYQRFISTYQSNRSDDAKTGDGYSNQFDLNKHLIFSLSVYIWDKKWLLHPPLAIAVNLTCNEEVPMIPSMPISQTNRSQQSMDFLSMRGSASGKHAAPTFETSRHSSSAELALRSGEISRARSESDQAGKEKVKDQVLAVESIATFSQPITPNGPPSLNFSTFSPYPILDEIQSYLLETHRNASSLSSNRNMMISPMLIELNESYDELDGLKFLDGNESANSISLGSKTIMNVRGITPHNLENLRITEEVTTSSNIQFGVIDLGKQSIKTERIEWLITIENQSKYHLLQYEIYEYSMNSVSRRSDADQIPLLPENQDHWLVVGRNAGILLPVHSTSFFVYFDRSTTGKYLSYLMIKSKVLSFRPELKVRDEIKEETFYIKSMYEVIPNDKTRRPSMQASASSSTLQEPFPLIRELSGLSWRALYTRWFMQYFKFEIDNEDRRPPHAFSSLYLESSLESNPILLARKRTHSTSSLKCINLTMLNFDIIFECSVDAEIAALVRLTVDVVGKESDKPSTSTTSSFNEHEMKCCRISCDITEEGVVAEQNYPEQQMLPVGKFICKANWIDAMEFTIPIFLTSS